MKTKKRASKMLENVLFEYTCVKVCRPASQFLRFANTLLIQLNGNDIWIQRMEDKASN